MNKTMKKPKKSSPVTISVNRLNVDTVSHFTSLVDFLFEREFEIVLDMTKLSSIDDSGKEAIENLNRKVELGGGKYVLHHRAPANCFGWDALPGGAV